MSNHLGRAQSAFAGWLVALASTGLCYWSFAAEPSQAYLFPRVASSALAILAVVSAVRLTIFPAVAGKGINRAEFLTIAPGLVIILIAALFAARFLGLYATTALSFFAITSIYDPRPHTQISSWLRRIGISVAFTLALYVLFNRVLMLFIPPGILF